jgi:Fe-coproporphyrin III synthase
VSPVIECLPVLVLSPHARCNCRCVMCDIWKETGTAELAAEELARHLADIERLSVRWIVFSGGEPLMHSDLFRLADMLRARDIRVTLLSTGLLLERYAEQIVGRLDDVIVSLDGPPAIHDRIRRVEGAFSKLEQGVRAIHALKPEFPVSARCTVQRLNYSSLVKTARQARSLGLRSISFLAADLTSEAFNRHRPWEAYRQAQVALTLEEVVVLERQLAALASEWQGTGFVLENAEKLSRIARHFRAQLGMTQHEAPRCNAPWVSAVIETGGEVRPCFFHRPIGSLRSQTLLQVLNGFEAQQFRMSLNVAENPTCRRCVCSLYLPESRTS